MKLYQEPLPHYKWSGIEKTLTPEEFFDFTQFILNRTLSHDEHGQTCVPKSDFREWSRRYATAKHNLEHIDWTNET